MRSKVTYKHMEPAETNASFWTNWGNCSVLPWNSGKTPDVFSFFLLTGWLTDCLNVIFPAGEKAKVDLMTVSAPGPAGRSSLSFFFQDDAELERPHCQMSTSTPDTALLFTSADQVDCHWGESFRVILRDNHSNQVVNTSNKTTIKLSDGER